MGEWPGFQSKNRYMHLAGGGGGYYCCNCRVHGLSFVRKDVHRRWTVQDSIREQSSAQAYPIFQQTSAF